MVSAMPAIVYELNVDKRKFTLATNTYLPNTVHDN